MAGRRGPLQDGERRICALILPRFQRPPVLILALKVELIESIWRGMPIGSFVVNDLSGLRRIDCADWLLDGQQRWTAIRDYVECDFAVYGVMFSELSKGQRSSFRAPDR